MMGKTSAVFVFGNEHADAARMLLRVLHCSQAEGVGLGYVSTVLQTCVTRCMRRIWMLWLYSALIYGDLHHDHKPCAACEFD